MIGWFVATALYGKAEARTRVAALWVPGSTVRAVPGGYWISLPRPAPERAPWPASPVVQTAAGPSTVPLTAAEADTLKAGTGVVILVGGHAARVHGTPVNPASWLDVRMERHVGAPLAPPPGPPPEVVSPPSSLREDFGLPSLAPALASLASDDADPRALLARRIARPSLTSRLRGLRRGGKGSRPTGGSLPSRLRAWFRRVLGGPRSDAPPGPSLARTASPSASEPPPPRAPSAALSWLRRTLSPLWIGRHLARSARVIDDILARFVHDDLDEALRWAIPIDRPPARRAVPRLASAPPQPRDRLEPATRRPSDGAGFHVEDELLDRLRRYYRDAARLLEQAGRIREAAFVLADLLSRPEEAVSMCERHEAWALAARLSELHLDDIGRTLVLLVRAGDYERTLRLGLHANALDKALELLDKWSPPHARRLRAAWAVTLVRGGQLLAAADVVSPDPVLYPTCEQWLQPLIEAGGVPGALAHLHLLGATGRTDEARAVAACFGETTGSDREAIFDRALDLPESALNTRLIRALLRHQLPVPLEVRARVRARGGAEDILEDAVLPPPPTARAAFLTGGRSVHDVVVLQNGPVVLATSTLVRTHLASGPELSRFPLRAKGLVSGPTEVVLAVEVEASGQAVIHRGWPLLGRWERWGELQLSSPPSTHGGHPWWPVHDGATWWVALSDRIVCLDLTARTPEALITQKGCQPRGLVTVEPEKVVANVTTDGDVEAWTWRGPRWRLSARERPQAFHKPAGRPSVEVGRCTWETRGQGWAGHRRFAVSPPRVAAWAPGLVVVGDAGGSVVSVLRLDTPPPPPSEPSSPSSGSAGSE